MLRRPIPAPPRRKPRSRNLQQLSSRTNRSDHQHQPRHHHEHPQFNSRCRVDELARLKHLQRHHKISPQGRILGHLHSNIHLTAHRMLYQAVQKCLLRVEEGCLIVLPIDQASMDDIVTTIVTSTADLIAQAMSREIATANIELLLRRAVLDLKNVTLASATVVIMDGRAAMLKSIMMIEV